MRMVELGSLTVQARIVGLVLALALVSPDLAWAAEETINITLDKATILKMPPRARTIVVGNPIIADVTTLKNDDLVVVTGKGYGETNMIFLDSSGAAVEEANVRVGLGSSLLTVQRGMDRESYSCQPRCEPTVTLGDADTFNKSLSQQITQRNTLSTPAGH